MALSAGRHPGSFSRKVLLLEAGDFERTGDQIKMPNYSEMCKIRAKEGQYRKDVEFHKNMSEEMVKRNLEETFPHLENKRFFCAAKVNVDNERSLFVFHGNPRIWDGRTIRKNIQGNSTLYVLEDDQSDTSGISGCEPETTQEELSGLIQWLQQNLHFEVSICPKESRLEGGVPCRFTFNPKLHPDVTSGHAVFENLGTVQLERLNNGDLLGTIPASPVPGLVTITLYSQYGIKLGQTVIKYYGIEEFLKQTVFYPSLARTVFEECNMCYNLGETTEQTQHSGILGSTAPDQLMSLLVYTAAKEGAQQFLEMIFNTSSGRVVFDAYKERSPLPEAIARKKGHEETAHYLEGITKRFSKEIKNGKECSKKIDWPELVKAAEAAEKRLNTTSEEDLKETAYLGDVDTSSESSQRRSSDSEEDISTTLRKASINDQQECDIRLQRDLHINDRKRGTKDKLKVGVHRKNNAAGVKDSCTSPGSQEAIKSETIGNDHQKMTDFSYLSEAEKQQDEKDLENLKFKTREVISKASDTVKSHRAAADKLDSVWMNCKIARATGSVSGIVGGLLTIVGGMITVLSWGGASPLLIAGIGAGAAGAATTVGTSIIEALINSSEIKKAEKDLQDTLEGVKEVNNTVHVWLDVKGNRRLFYICYLADLTLKFSDPAVIKILQTVVVPHLTLSDAQVLGVLGWAVVQAATTVALEGGVQVGARVALGGAMQGGRQAGAQAAGKLFLGVSAVVWEIRDLSYSIKDIVQNKGSEAAQCLRERADNLEKELEKTLPIRSKDH